MLEIRITARRGRPFRVEDARRIQEMAQEHGFEPLVARKPAELQIHLARPGPGPGYGANERLFRDLAKLMQSLAAPCRAGPARLELVMPGKPIRAEVLRYADPETAARLVADGALPTGERLGIRLRSAAHSGTRYGARTVEVPVGSRPFASISKRSVVTTC